MPAGPKTTIWNAEPHTIAKIKILEAYLVAYFQILGSSRSRQTLLYIDGFAGPNQYKNSPFGSPTAAITAATKAINNLPNKWIAADLHFAFVEPNKTRFDNLLNQLPSTKFWPNIKVHTYNTEFTKAFPQIKRDVPEPFQSNHPLFVFIDPFGATGAPFANIAEILSSNCSELLINLDADGIGRIFQAKQNANYKVVLNEIFGDPSWQDELNDNQTFDVQCRKILQIYKERLRTLPGVRYIFEIEMLGPSNLLNYFLVFASKHPLGLIKMKEAMKAIAQNGTYRFSDANIGQTSLFHFNEPDLYCMKLYNEFKGREVIYDSQTDEITAYALNHTPFINAKSILSILEKQNMITVSSDAERKRGTFNESVKSVNFHGRNVNGVLFED